MKDEHWLDIAGAILDGRDVSWDTPPSDHSADDAIPIDALRLISAVAQAHRTDRWGPFELLEKVGQGTFGEVYRVRDTALDRDVALKLLPYAPAAPGLEEGKLLARVRHPNVVTVHGAGAHDGRYGIWMEFIRGRTLAAIVEEHGPLPWQEVARIGADVCAALAAMHGCGLLHGDVKARNVMREDGGRSVLMDFGTGRFAADPTRRVSGTPLYVAPEVLARGRADARADIYSTGVLLYYLLTGTYPIEGDSLGRIRAAHDAQRRVPIRRRTHRCPRSLARIIERATSSDPVDRFQNTGTFEVALRRLVRRRAWRRTALVTTGAVMLVLTAMGTRLWTANRSPHIRFQPRDWVLVTGFENRTGDKRLDHTIEHALEYEVANSSYVNVIPPERVEDTLRLMARPADTAVNAAVGREIALRDGGIRLVLDGAIDRLGKGYALTVQVVQPSDGAVLATDREEAVSADDLPGAVRKLSAWVRTTVGESRLSVNQDLNRMLKATTPSLEAVRLFSEGMRAFNLERFPEAEMLFTSALANDPNFASAHIWLAWTLRNMNRPPKEYLRSAQRAVDLAASASEHEREWIEASFSALTYRNDRALEQFEAMVRHYPDDLWAFRNLLFYYEAAGRQQDTVEVARRLADLDPNNFVVQVQTASKFLQHAGIGAARPWVARAQRLLSSADNADTWVPDFKVWVLLFPAHEAWTQGRAADAARVATSISGRPELALERRWTWNVLGGIRLALGQVRLAEQAYSHIDQSNLKALSMAAVALAREQPATMAVGLKDYQGTDYGAVSLLVRAGHLDAADRVLIRMMDASLNRAWAVEEIEEARGNHAVVRRALGRGLPWTDVMMGMRAFLYTETLARAADHEGDRPSAIKVLEQVAPFGERAYQEMSAAGFYWMRSQKLLADLYRKDGHIDKARAIEQALLARLAVADPDYPLLLELRQRVKSAP